MSGGLDSATAATTAEEMKRHCAFCLKEISGEAIKKCAKCHKRAYCSKECQTEDWTPNKKNGQGHKNWCGTDYGEEDVDWAVVPVPGKGLGIVALRDIPKAYPIVVETGVDKTHPRVAELTPLNGSLEMKFHSNKYSCVGRDGVAEEVLCLRMSRVNHSCVPNADNFYDKSVKVNILFSLRDIKKGEEVCISYLGFDDLNSTMSPYEYRLVLRMRWQIVCDPNCVCFDRVYCENVEKGRELRECLMSQGMPRAQARCMKKLKNDWIVSVTNLMTTYEDGLKINIKEMTAEQFGRDLIEEVAELTEQIMNQPEPSERKKKYKGDPFATWRFRVLPGRTP